MNVEEINNMDQLYKSIDRLRAKVDANKKIRINDACYILWAELCVCSDQYLAFKEWVVNNNIKGNFIWDVWKGIFYSYLDSLTKEESELPPPKGGGFERSLSSPD